MVEIEGYAFPTILSIFSYEQMFCLIRELTPFSIYGEGGNQHMGKVTDATGHSRTSFE